MSHLIGRGRYSGETYSTSRTASSVVPEYSGTSLPFNFSSPSQIVLAALGIDDVVTRATVSILTPFDDPNAIISLGTSADPGKILDGLDVSPGRIGQYDSSILWAPITPDLLILTVNPGVSVQGTALLYYAIGHTG